MSQILIISDTHFMRKNVILEFLQQFHDLKAVIHCGDIYLGYEPGELDLPYEFHICKGNNDFGNLPIIHNFAIDGIRFTITHGNQNNFAYNPPTLKVLLDDYPADIICFGHTHVPYYYQEDNVVIINPGSLALGRTYPRQNTYALLDTKTKEIHFYDVKTNQEIQVQKQP